MFLKVSAFQEMGCRNVNMRCPKCRKLGTFEWSPEFPDIHIGDNIIIGNRRCPDPGCRNHLFVVLRAKTGKIVISYPAERINFDTTDIPSSIVNTLEEAITCHANHCFTASAIMVRKTLEELCSDQKATGKNLHQRIQSLSTKIVIPQQLLDGMHNLRLLGNDAAHVESKTYKNIGRKELEIAIKFTEEILKAVYQYSSLLQELESLKATN